MSKTTFTATAPDGETFTRKSARSYSHAVLALGASELVNCDTETWQRDKGWGVWSFNGRPELAAKAAEEARKHYGEVVVVEAVAR